MHAANLTQPCCVQEERAAFKLKQFLMVVRAYTDPTQQQGGSKQQQKSKKKKQPAGEGVVHFLPEAECYQAAAEWSFSFPVTDRLVGKDELQPSTAADTDTCCRHLPAFDPHGTAALIHRRLTEHDAAPTHLCPLFDAQSRCCEQLPTQLTATGDGA